MLVKNIGNSSRVWLRHHHQRTVSRATISRYLTRHGLVVPKPKKQPRSSCIRFEAALPNETWQADVTHYRLADGSDAEILNWLDGRSRYALLVTYRRRVTGPIVRDTFSQAVAAHGVPVPTLTDNGKTMKNWLPSPCTWTAGFTTSASPEPTSSSWSPTCTPASSTLSPESFSVS
ncbi:DDE-type integrase/transposase/recombinase [Nonomuraea sp. NPDC003707]